MAIFHSYVNVYQRVAMKKCVFMELNIYNIYYVINSNQQEMAIS